MSVDPVKLESRVLRGCREILLEVERGLLDKEAAYKRLRVLEESAYETNPLAEEDGNITYAVATTWDAILAYEKIDSR